MSFRCFVRLQLQMENYDAVIFERETVVRFIIDRSRGRRVRLRPGGNRKNKQSDGKKDAEIHISTFLTFLVQAHMIGSMRCRSDAI